MKQPALEWQEAVPGCMPEDILPHKKYKLWGQDREATGYVLVCREHRERPDSCIRIKVNGTWAWANGDGITRVTHWAEYNRAVPWDEAAHKKYIRELHEKIGKEKNSR